MIIITVRLGSNHFRLGQNGQIAVLVCRAHVYCVFCVQCRANFESHTQKFGNRLFSGYISSLDLVKISNSERIVLSYKYRVYSEFTLRKNGKFASFFQKRW